MVFEGFWVVFDLDGFGWFSNVFFWGGWLLNDFC